MTNVDVIETWTREELKNAFIQREQQLAQAQAACAELVASESTTAGQDLLSRLERYETSISLAIPVLAEVSKACCDMADWDQIDGDQVNTALNACREALEGTP